METTQHVTGLSVGSGGTNLYQQRWIPDSVRGLLLFVHGIGEHSDRYLNLVSPLTARGILVAGYDQRGHGRSEGLRGHIAHWDEYHSDLALMVRSLRQDFPQLPLFLLGHSMGGLVVLEYLQHQPTEVRGAIVSAPPIDTRGVAKPTLVMLARILTHIWPSLSVTLPIEATALSRDVKVINAYRVDPLVNRRVTVRWGTEIMATQAVVRARARDIRTPLLLVHGEADRIASARASGDFFAHLGSEDKELHIYPAAFHELHNDTNHEQVVHDYQLWLQRRLLPGPTGEAGNCVPASG